MFGPLFYEENSKRNISYTWSGAEGTFAGERWLLRKTCPMRNTVRFSMNKISCSLLLFSRL